MKYILVILMSFVISACCSSQKKEKLSGQENQPTQNRTLASTEEATSGSFILLHNFRFDSHPTGITGNMNRYCDTKKSFVFVAGHGAIICVKK